MKANKDQASAHKKREMIAVDRVCVWLLLCLCSSALHRVRAAPTIMEYVGVSGPQSLTYDVLSQIPVSSSINYLFALGFYSDVNQEANNGQYYQAPGEQCLDLLVLNMLLLSTQLWLVEYRPVLPKWHICCDKLTGSWQHPQSH